MSGRLSELGWPSTRSIARCWGRIWSTWGGQICRWDEQFECLEGVINQGIDAWLHVNPGGQEKGLAMVFNPTGIRSSFYGLTDIWISKRGETGDHAENASLLHWLSESGQSVPGWEWDYFFLYSFIHDENQAGGKWESFILKRDYSIDLPIDMAPVSLTYFVIM